MKSIKKLSVLALAVFSIIPALANVEKNDAAVRTVEYGACWQYGRKGTHVYSDLSSSTNRRLHTRSVGTQNVSSGWKTRFAGSSAWAVGVAGYSYYNIK